MKHRKSKMGESRDLGIPSGPGKGSKSRITSQAKFAEGFDEIDWSPKTPISATPVTNDIIRE